MMIRGIASARRIRVVVAIALLCSSVVAARALAALTDFDYFGHVRGDPAAEVGFRIRVAQDHRSVRKFMAFNTPYSCSDAPSDRTGGLRFGPNMRIHPDRTFERSGDWVNAGFDPAGAVSGKLRRHGVAVGSFRIRGELAGPGTHCHTGPLEWRATKQSQG